MTQQELASASATTTRMVAAYEVQGRNPPLDVIPRLAKALRVSIDDLFDHRAAAASDLPRNVRLARRFHAIEQLPVDERRQIIEFIDTVLERDTLRKRRLA